MQNGARTNMRTRQSKPAASFAPRSRQSTSNAVRPELKGFQNAQRNYERYLALAQAEVQALKNPLIFKPTQKPIKAPFFGKNVSGTHHRVYEGE